MRVVIRYAVSLSLLTVFYWFGLFLYSRKWYINSEYGNRILFKGKSSQEKEKCKLPRPSPWDESIMPYFNHRFGYQKQCNHDKLRTKFVNGILEKTNEEDHCWGRCLYWKDDYDYKTGEWTDKKKQFKCDIIEAKCSTNGTIEEFDYYWLHTQIYENKKILKKFSGNSNYTIYNVIIIILDSTSHTQSIRNIGKSVTYLTKGMNAVPFPYLNRVGLNTKPNMFALFQGAIPEKVDRSMFNEESLEESVNMDKLCHMQLDNFTFIQDEFQNNNYVTGFFEDWNWGWSNYPNCRGMLEKSAEHMNSPFRLAWDSNRDLLNEQNYCDSEHQLMFDHVGQFLDSYKGIPKMITLIDTGFGHDDVSTSLEADDILYDFFIKNRNLLKNSFIFLMGDHGLRVGSAPNSKLGQFEINNPMLYVVPPADLAKDKDFMDVLRENSQKLQTHRDVRETLLDILKYQPFSNFSNRKQINDNPHGSSFLRFQEGERSCRTLPIPFQYCICEHKEEEQDLNSPLAKRIGQFVTDYVNQQISKANLTTKCFEWAFDEVTILTKVDAVETVDKYKVEIVVKPNGKLKTMVTDFRNGKFLAAAVDRADTYGRRGDCVEETYRRLCDCKI